MTSLVITAENIPPNEVLLGLMVRGWLESIGAGQRGELWHAGPQVGCISSSYDMLFGDLTFTWSPEVPETMGSKRVVLSARRIENLSAGWNSGFASIFGVGTDWLKVGTAAIRELRSAGVPVSTFLWPAYCESGTLTVYADDLFGDLIFEWSDK